jgi:hypothetical protein
MSILEILPDTKTYRQRRRVQGAEEAYTVAIRIKDARWSCGCKHWIFRCSKAGTDCKHIDELRRVYGSKPSANKIVESMHVFMRELNSGISTDMALQRWSALKDRAEMLEYYYLNTPDNDATEVTTALNQIRAKLKEVLAA